MSARCPAGVAALFWRCGVLLGIAALPIAFNVWIDPARILGSPRAVRAITAALLAGHNVTDVMTYDGRAITKLYAEERSDRPDVLAVGSSRIQALRASAFPGASFVNAGVSGGRFEEMLGAYELYDSPTRRPRHVILNVDPFSFSEDMTDADWRALSNERSIMLTRLGVKNSLFRDRWKLDLAAIKRLVSPEYFRLSVFALRHFGPRGIGYVITDSAQNIEKTKTSEGSLVWDPVSVAQTDERARLYVADLASRSEQFRQIGTKTEVERVAEFERLLRYMKGEGIDVLMLLVPYHPLAYAALERLPDHPLSRSEARYRELAKRTGTPVAGSYDPFAVGITGADMFDESHMRPDALVRLVHQGLNGPLHR